MRFTPLIMAAVLSLTTGLGAVAASSNRQPRSLWTPQPKETLDLASIPYRLVYETYRPTQGKENWELFTIKADGSDPVNLTNTPDIHEMYPHVSPDGTKIAFVVDEGRGRKRVRHVYYMNADGTERVHVAEHARQPCWCFDSKSIAYLKGEYKRFSSREYATSGLMFYYLERQWHRPHANDELHHLYAICWSPDGRWFLAAVQGGMRMSDAIIAFEAFGSRHFDLASSGVKGCRPSLSTDGKRMVWGETDWNLKIGEFDTSGSKPRVENIREIVRCGKGYKVYHVDLSPDGRYIAFSYGPSRGGQQVSGKAKDWNICIGDLTGTWVQITTDGLHNKEPDWIPMPPLRIED